MGEQKYRPRVTPKLLSLCRARMSISSNGLDAFLAFTGNRRRAAPPRDQRVLQLQTISRFLGRVKISSFSKKSQPYPTK